MFRVEKPLGHSGSGGFSLSPRWPTVSDGDAAEDARARPEAGGMVGRAGDVAPRRQRPRVREIEAGERSPSFETWDRICKLLRLAADVHRVAVLTIR